MHTLSYSYMHSHVNITCNNNNITTIYKINIILFVLLCNSDHLAVVIIINNTYMYLVENTARELKQYNIIIIKHCFCSGSVISDHDRLHYLIEHMHNIIYIVNYQPHYSLPICMTLYLYGFDECKVTAKPEEDMKREKEENVDSEQVVRTECP